MAPESKRVLKRIMVAISLVIVLTATVFSLEQKEFKNSTFELGTVIELTGVLLTYPAPMLRVQIEENSFKNIMLLGYGKFGANAELQKINSKVSKIEGMKISLKGTLIYYDGKTLFQVEEGQEPYEIKDTDTILKPSKIDLGSMVLEGEIIDPKCYFGVMKPGFGKIHRSCAVRCISGGIPPVLITSNAQGEASYFIITDKNGKPINKAILPYVGKPCRVLGQMEQVEDWLVLKTDISDIQNLDKKSKIY